MSRLGDFLFIFGNHHIIFMFDFRKMKRTMIIILLFNISIIHYDNQSSLFPPQ